MNIEQTLVILKPDSQDTPSQAEVYKKFKNILSKRWMNISQQTEFILSENIIKQHYQWKEEHPLYNEVVSYMNSWKSIIIEIKWIDVIKRVRLITLSLRKILLSQEPGKIYNLIHASDSLSEAKRERKVHFPHT